MAENITGLTIGLSLDTIKVDTGLQSLKSKLTMVNSEMKNNMSAFDRGEKSLGKYQTQLDGLNKKIEVQKAVTAAAQKNYEKMVKEHGEGSVQAEKAATQYNNQAAALNNLERYVDGVTKEMKEFAEAQKVAESGFTKFGDKMQDVGGKFTAAGAKMKDVGKSLSMKVTAPIVGIGLAAVKVGADFQEGMSQVKAISGATGQEIESLEKTARNLGATTQFSAKEAADGMQFLAMAGFKTNDIISAMPGMLDLAAAGALELGSAADIASNILSAFSIDASESGHVADVLAAAAANANTDVSQLGEAMKYLAPSANSLGWSLEDSTSAIMALGDAGIQGSMAGQAFASSLTRLANPTKKMGKVLKATGAEFFNAEGVMKSMPEVVKELEIGMEGMTQEQKAANLTTLFGAEAYKHWAVLLEKGSGALAENKNMLEGADGAASDMAKTMNDNAKGDLKIFQSAMQELSIQIYDILEPSVRKIIQSLTGFAEKIQNMPQGLKVAALSILGIAAAVGPVLVGLGAFAASIGSVITFVGSASAAIGIMGTGVAAATPLIGGLATVFTVLTGPIGIAVGALAAIGVGAVALGNHLKKDAIPEVDRFGKGVSESTKEALGGFFDLSDGASQQLTTLNIKGKAITQEMADSITTKYGKMNTQILEGMKKRHTDEIAETTKMFAESSALSIGREEEILKQQKIANDKQVAEQVKLNAHVKKITDRAAKEKRELTESEKSQLNFIQEEMNKNAVKYLTDNERDQKVILERMKSESSKITALQAAEVVKNSKDATDKVIKDAGKKRDETIAFAIQQRDETGLMSKQEAQAVIDDAEAKYKESTKKAKDTHKEVVESAKSQAKEHVKEVDWETGEVKTKWEVMRTNVVDTSKKLGKGAKTALSDMWTGIKKDSKDGWDSTKLGWNEMTGKVTDNVKKFGSGAVKLGSEMWTGLKKDSKSGWDSTKLGWNDMTTNVSNKAKDLKDNTTKFFGDKWTSLKNTTTNGANNIKTGWNDLKNNVVTKVSDLSTGAKTKYNDMKTSLISKTNDIKSGISNGFTTAKDKVIDTVNNMKTKALSVFTEIVKGATALPGKMKDGIVSMASKAVDGIRNVGNKMATMFGSVVNGLIKGLNSITSTLGVGTNIKEWKVPQFHAGTDAHKGGLMVVGDKYGREIVELPNGQTFISPDTDTLVNAPKGTRVIPNKITEQYLSGDIPHFAKGAGVKDWVKDKASSFKNAMSNIWDHVSNPGKLIEMMGLPSLSGAVGGFGTIIKGASSKLRESAVEYIKNMFSKAESPNVGGYGTGPGGAGSGFPSPFRMVSAYGMRFHPVDKVWRMHNGNDFPAPYGTPIPNQVAGTVVRSQRGTGWDAPRGNFVQVRTGNMDRVYQHNSRNLVRAGQSVTKGQTVGLVGSTGKSTGNHLHYEVWRNGKPINPRGLATGGRVDNPGLFNLTEEGHSEFVIPTAPKRRTDAMKLLALAAQSLGSGDKKGVHRPNSLGGNGGVFEDMVNILLEQNQLLMKLLQKNTDVYLDGEQVGRGVYDTVDGMNYDKTTIAAYMRGVRI
ncbi:phage tail tape measure protein [Sporosarcina sp. P21c]|uniref:phage tail tape measure protein n=1 Tax=Sporosarcina sp. P21c TaxID=2048255 RepID=UPI000C170112|nr:phage tail tape measure protein [Sporosarcina sp. P21c]PIC88432.1 phage tail tape measure protein [Sporosarcina sp. P21c]